MLKEIKTRPAVMPAPVFVVGTFDGAGTPDAMNVAWGGQCWDREVALNLSDNHKTTENLRLNKAFTLHLADTKTMALADFFGIVSGHHTSKLKDAGIGFSEGRSVHAPIIEGFRVVMECRLKSMEDNGDGGVRVVGEVVRTLADDTVLGPDGKIDYSALLPISYDSERMVYRPIGDAIGQAFHDGKVYKK